MSVYVYACICLSLPMQQRLGIIGQHTQHCMLPAFVHQIRLGQYADGSLSLGINTGGAGEYILIRSVNTFTFACMMHMHACHTNKPNCKTHARMRMHAYMHTYALIDFNQSINVYSYIFNVFHRCIFMHACLYLYIYIDNSSPAWLHRRCSQVQPR